MNIGSYRASKKHFADKEDSKSANDHFFEQLDWDLEWAVGAAHTFMERDGRVPSDALLEGFRAIAGRRYSRFRTAEEEENSDCAKEMKMFAHFWYRLCEEIGRIAEELSEEA